MKTRRLPIGVVLAALALQGCATATERNVNEKVASEAQVASAADIGREAERRLEELKGVSEVQKHKLHALQSDTRTRMEALNGQSLRLRAVLVKSLTSEKYDAKEVRILKRKIRDVENKRVTLMFNAADEMNRILGREFQERSNLVARVLEVPRGAD